MDFNAGYGKHPLYPNATVSVLVPKVPGTLRGLLDFIMEPRWSGRVMVQADRDTTNEGALKVVILDGDKHVQAARARGFHDNQIIAIQEPKDHKGIKGTPKTGPEDPGTVSQGAGTTGNPPNTRAASPARGILTPGTLLSAADPPAGEGNQQENAGNNWRRQRHDQRRKRGAKSRSRSNKRVTLGEVSTARGSPDTPPGKIWQEVSSKSLSEGDGPTD